MIDPSSVQNNLNDLVSRVGPVDQRAARHIQNLSASLGNLTQARVWGGIDLPRVINPDAIAECYERLNQPAHSGPGSLARALEAGRNVLIFLPIAITWLAISQATSAYHQLLSQCLQHCPNQVQQPFLYLWEQGFGGGFPDLLRLSNVGLIDAGILALILLATLYVSAAAGRSNRWQEYQEQRVRTAAQTLRLDLTNSLADASLLLRDTAAPIASPIDRLDEVARAIVQMSRDILGQFGDLKSSLKDVADQMAQQFRTTEEATNRLLSQVGDINTMMRTLQAAIDQFQAAGNAVSNRLNDLVRPIEDLTRKQGDLLDRVNASADHLRDSATHLENLRTDQKRWGDQIADTLGQQDDVIGKLDSVANTLSNLDGHLDDFLLKLQDEREAQERQAEQIAEASRSFSEALDYTRAEASQIRNVAVDISNVVTMMGRLSSPSGMDVSAIVDGYATAAQTIDQSANTLSETAIAIFGAAQELKDAATEFRAVAANQP
ncbi:MAG TPA: methyl-accepting chemotaxis protein [Ktedonobacteraceae bacterium]